MGLWIANCDCVPRRLLRAVCSYFPSIHSYFAATFSQNQAIFANQFLIYTIFSRPQIPLQTNSEFRKYNHTHSLAHGPRLTGLGEKCSTHVAAISARHYSWTSSSVGSGMGRKYDLNFRWIVFLVIFSTFNCRCCHVPINFTFAAYTVHTMPFGWLRQRCQPPVVFIVCVRNSKRRRWCECTFNQMCGTLDENSITKMSGRERLRLHRLNMNGWIKISHINGVTAKNAFMLA